MQIKNVRGIRLSARRLSKKKAELAVSDSVLREVIVGGLVKVTVVSVNF
jgi:hypothetical protein